jgi:formylglycine-generating enzyme required for sulfatase activity
MRQRNTDTNPNTNPTAAKRLSSPARRLGLAWMLLVGLVAWVALAPRASAQASNCVGDLDGDRIVGAFDLGLMLDRWGACTGSPCLGDLSGDGLVNGVDVANLVINWGYCAPTVTLTMPSNGPVGGGTTMTITGSAFHSVSAVTIGGVAATSVTVLSPTKIVVVTPPGTVGVKPVAVTTPGGTATLSTGFRYANPTWFTVLESAPDAQVVASGALRNAIAGTGFPWRVRDNASGVEMLLVPPGTYEMGCTPSNEWSCSPNESPVHTVTLTNAFYVGRYEVTQQQWQARMGSNPSYYQPANGFPADLNRPVESLNYFQLQPFFTATGLRLLTESEWEYACRAGTTTAFHSGPGFPNGTSNNQLLGQIAWGPGSTLVTQPVGTKAANALGLHDMHGNVQEWVKDWWANYPATPQINPNGPTAGKVRLLRGGSINIFDPLDGDAVRSSGRRLYFPEYGGSDIGFRVARTP